MYLHINVITARVFQYVEDLCQLRKSNMLNDLRDSDVKPNYIEYE